MSKNLDHPTWFLYWSFKPAYMTMICGWTRRSMVRNAEKSQNMTWKQIYRRGGRAVRVKMSIVKGEAKKKGS